MHNYRYTFGDPQPSDNRKIVLNHQIEGNAPMINQKNKSSMQLFHQKLDFVEKKLINRHILQKLSTVCEQLYQLIFLKESVLSMVGQQKIKMTDFMRQLKKYLFQFEMKNERQSFGKQSRQIYGNNNSLTYNNSTNTLISNEGHELKNLYENLYQEHQQLKKKYQAMLFRYREEIQTLSVEMVQPINESSIAQSNKQLKRIIRDLEDKLKAQHGIFIKKVQYLQSQMCGLQEQYLKEKEDYQRQIQRYRSRQKQYTFQQSQIQRKNILLIQREKALNQRQIILRQQNNAIQRREVKIFDFQQNQIRREKQNAQNERNAIRNEYYVNYDNRIKQSRATRKHQGSHSEREISGSKFINSKVDIHARLRQIEQQKKRSGPSIKGSRYSQAGGIRNQHSSSRGKSNVMGFQLKKQIKNENVNVKLNSMLESLEKDLHDIN